jgi:protein-disulfide isomerase
MKFLFRTIAALILIITGSGLLSPQPASGADKEKVSTSKGLATIDGAPITENQARTEGAASLDSLELQTLRAKATAARKEHEILEDAVERIIEDRLLQAEAKKRGITKEELLAKEVLQKISEPTAEEIDRVYDENKQRIGGRPKEDVAPSISRYLKQEAESNIREVFVKSLEKEHQVKRFLEPLRYNVKVAGRPTLGPASAPVLLVLFSDFQCPYCKKFSETLKEVRKNYGDKVQLVFRQFPLTEIHPYAQQSAEASLCAQAQGHFWEMHDLLFEDQSHLQNADLKNRAGKLGLDASTFSTCLDSAHYGNQIKEDVRAGSTAGVEGTPALFINGRFLDGSRSYEEVAGIIDEELQGKKQK